jgi:hypothetical protein
VKRLAGPRSRSYVARDAFQGHDRARQAVSEKGKPRALPAARVLPKRAALAWCQKACIGRGDPLGFARHHQRHQTKAGLHVTVDVSFGAIDLDVD